MPDPAEPLGPSVPPSAGASRGTVVLVHGLWMTGLELQWLARGLRGQGFRVHTFRYPSVRMSLADNARRLARFYEHQTLRAADAEKTHLVGHSLGGLVIGQMLRDYPALIARTGRVVALGSPFLGSASAKVLCGLPLGTHVAGQCFPAAEDAARLPESLPWDVWEPALDLGIIAGTFSLGLGTLFRVFSTPNDGVVAVEETRLPGATAHLTLPVNHVALTFSGRVLRQTHHFLEHGGFLPEPECAGVPASAAAV